MKFLYRGFIDASFEEICKTDVSAVGGVMDIPLEMLHGIFIDRKHTLAFRFKLTFLIGLLTLLYLDIIFFCKITQSLTVAQVLQLHKEIDGTTPSPTAEALAKSTRL